MKVMFFATDFLQDFLLGGATLVLVGQKKNGYPTKKRDACFSRKNRRQNILLERATPLLVGKKREKPTYWKVRRLF